MTRIRSEQTATEIRSESARLVDLSSRVMTGDPWHAGNVEDLLADVTVREAVARPLPGVHSIWEIVLHMTGWVDEVERRLSGHPAGLPADGDWPRVGRPTAARWQAARAALKTAHRRLERRISRLSDDALITPVSDPRNRVTGTGLSRDVTAHGAVHHTVYHAGQIASIKRALRTR